MRAEFPSPDVCIIDGFLSSAECLGLVERAEVRSFERAPVATAAGARIVDRLRNNERVVEDDPVLADWLWGRLRPVFPGTFRDRFTAVGLNERFRFYRYGPGQRFDWHRDGSFARAPGEESRFTLLVYLDEGCEGGETLFRDLPDMDDMGNPSPRTLAVRPRTGRALLFHHPLDHKGDTVHAGVKHVLRSDVMYRDDGTE